MSVHSSPPPTAAGHRVARALDYAVRHAFELFLVALIIYICISRGLSLSVDMYDPVEPTSEAQTMELSFGSLLPSLVEFRNKAAGLLTLAATTEEPVNYNQLETTVAIDAAHPGFNEVAVTDDPAPHISNLTLVLSPDYGRRKGLPQRIITAKKARVQSYLRRYAEAARAEMREHGIPASITLAQGLLESNAGDSKLARVSNNHFGIKCRAKCLGCTCRNYGDDTRYDMFRVFDNPAESFREHSKLLNYSRYKKLKGYGMNYVKWAHGLQSCGYATDKKYGSKLVKIIENLGLDKYDA